MSIISWNCQGLGNPKAIRILRNLAKEKDPVMMFLIETKLDVKRMEKVRASVGFQYVFTVPSKGRSGGLALMWKDSIEVRVQTFSQHHVDVHVHMDTNSWWRLTGFYGHPEPHKRHETWKLLNHLGSRNQAPWLCMGDFNEILSQEEKRGVHLQPLRQMMDFRDTITACSLIDIGYRGPPYTWNNNRDPPAFVQERLDRALATSEWLTLFGFKEAIHIPTSKSDHLAIQVDFHKSAPQKPKRKSLFRFEEKWSYKPECEQVIATAWQTAQLTGSPMFQVTEKIKLCRQALMKWCGTTFGSVKKQLDQKKSEMEHLMSSNLDGAHNQSIYRLKGEINELLLQDELHWRQRSRAVWLESGDKNTKFFHQKATQRRRTNTITGLLDSLDIWQEDTQVIGRIIENYFSQMFTSATQCQTEITTETLDQVVTPLHNQTLLSPYTAEEIKKAVFQMHPSKSPGPDGMSCFFFQKYWHILGDNITQAVLSFLSSGHLLKKINYTHIVLIPKIKNPQQVSDYRPISLCNVLYKIVSKVLANRLQQVLPSVISDSQSAFIPGRLITDNVAVAFELLHSMKQKRTGITGQMAMKLDMSKAYDRVEWKFLRAAMLKLGFASRWVELIMECVTTPTYSILINGIPQGFIKPSRGIRQGDPLSPYLFLLCAEGLSGLLRKAERENKIHGVAASRYGPKISHLLFADDSLLLSKASVEECQNILRILDIYENSSGQKINREKTALFFSPNTKENTQAEITKLLGASSTSTTEKYLGLPIFIGKSKNKTFQGLKEKVAKKLSGWKEKKLSKAGREILIKAVAQAIPSYTMSCFKLPKSWCDDLQRMVARFWWGQQSSERKLHWVNWTSLCRAKKEGGLGFRNLHRFNIALLAKQGWRLLDSPHTLFSRVFKAKYFPSTSFLHAKPGHKPSFLWSSILAAQNLLRSNTQWTVGNGRSIGVWTDHWLPRIPTCRPGAEHIEKVYHLIDPDTHSWNRQLIQENFAPQDASAILAIQLNAITRPDRLCWQNTRSKLFTVRSAYHHTLHANLDHSHSESSSAIHLRRFWKSMWRLSVPSKCKHLLWRACTASLPTRNNLRHRGIMVDPKCLFCNIETETITHILWACPMARNVWGIVPGKLQKMSHTENLDFRDLTMAVASSNHRRDFELWTVITWSIWTARNKFLFEGIQDHPDTIYNSATSFLLEYQNITMRSRIMPTPDIQQS
jgi:exonuclease III